MALEITQYLLAAQSPDAKIRTEAESTFAQFRDQNLPVYLLSLSAELSNEGKPTESRRLAGIILKNSLDAKEAARKDQLLNQWVAIDISFKCQIKNSLLITLGSSVREVSHTASQVIAKVASIEIPRKEWPDLIGLLLTNMTQPDRPASSKQATLETLGYVCEEISSEALVQEEVNAVLTAVVQGMNVSEQNPAVRLAATKALCNALDFARTNFENEMERNYIMKVVCDGALANETEIRQAAFECLVSIASTYYEVLEPYMPKIFELTANAVKGDEEAVSLQALEFWSSICDVELEMQDYEAPDPADTTDLHSNFIQKALPHLVPLLLETLLKQDEDQDQDDGIWNLAMAGGTCLGLVARTVGDSVVPLVMPFVQENISKNDWRSREAATYAFGSILEGPTTEKLSPMVNSGLDFLLNAMNDENSHVKDTTAWTLGRIFEFLHSPATGFSVVTHANFPKVLSVLLEGLNAAPHVADKACGALYFLALGYENAGPSTSMLTPHLPNIAQSLVITSARTDSTGSKLMTTAFETLNAVVRCSNLSETAQIIAELLPAIMSKLEETLNLQIVSSDDREKQGELQGALCGSLMVLIQKLNSAEATKPVVLQFADKLMMLFLHVFACRSSTVHEEAMLAIGALAYVTGPSFEKYMSEFCKYLEMGLSNFEEYEVCSVTVGVVGDVCRALEDKILPFCDRIMMLLINDLKSDQMDRSVKPPMFSVFGDIAIAIGDQFEKYAGSVFPIMQGAMELCTKMDNTDEEMMEYGNQLKRSIFEAYSGIFQGFKDTKPELIYPQAEILLKFIEIVGNDRPRDECVVKAAVAVMGDLADAIGANLKLIFNEHPNCRELIVEAVECDDEDLKSTGIWTKTMFERAFATQG